MTKFISIAIAMFLLCAGIAAASVLGLLILITLDELFGPLGFFGGLFIGVWIFLTLGVWSESGDER